MLHLFSCYSTNKCHAPLQNLIYRGPIPGSYCLQQLSWRVNFVLGKGRRPDCSPSQEQIQFHVGCCVLGAELAQQRKNWSSSKSLKAETAHREMTHFSLILKVFSHSVHPLLLQDCLRCPLHFQGVLRDPVVHWRYCQCPTNRITHNTSPGLCLCSAGSVCSLETVHDALSFLKQLFRRGCSRGLVLDTAVIWPPFDHFHKGPPGLESPRVQCRAQQRGRNALSEYLNALPRVQCRAQQRGCDALPEYLNALWLGRALSLSFPLFSE